MARITEVNQKEEKDFRDEIFILWCLTVVCVCVCGGGGGGAGVLREGACSVLWGRGGAGPFRGSQYERCQTRRRVLESGPAPVSSQFQRHERWVGSTGEGIFPLSLLGGAWGRGGPPLEKKFMDACMCVFRVNIKKDI